jgi:predicted kinase
VSRKPTLYLLCGLPGSGKTTLAKRLEQDTPALRLTPDEWMTPLYGASICEPDTLEQWNSAHDRVEKVQWQIAERALVLGVSVVLDFGVWAREERDDFRTRAAALGARSELTFLDVPLIVLKARVKARNEVPGHGAYPISEAELEQWSTLFQRPSPDELEPRESG